MAKQTIQPVVLPTQIRSRSPSVKGGYFATSAQPLHILAFLLPPIIIYELGSTGLIGNGVAAKLEAQDMLVRFFDLFGVLGLHLPAVALIATLLIQHVLSRNNWRLSPPVLLAMIAESTFLTGPLIVLGVLLEPVAAMMLQEPAIVSQTLSTSEETFQGVFLAFGAGIYEEMLFRLVLITILHFVVTDVLGFKYKTGVVVAVALSALAFAWHHNEVMLPGVGINWRLACFYVIAGGYFGVLYISRGLGVAVGVHLMYDLLVFVIMPGIQPQQ